jgi:enamine deaminase RidA (YjgF/YER057c/UK114 family)
MSRWSSEFTCGAGRATSKDMAARPDDPQAPPKDASGALSAINPPDWVPPRGYQNGMLAPPGRRLLAVAGQIGWDGAARLVQPAAGEDAFVAQFAQALRNVLTVVRCAGGDVGDLMSLRVYVTDKRRYLLHSKALGHAYREVLGRHYPAMALVQVADLVEEGALVEIEALAALA